MRIPKHDQGLMTKTKIPSTIVVTAERTNRIPKHKYNFVLNLRR